MKTLLVTLILNLYFFTHATNDPDDSLNPIVLIQPENLTEASLHLPDKIETLPDGTLTYATRLGEKVLYLCPIENQNDDISYISKYYDAVNTCLFEKTFETNEEKKCNSQPRLEFVPIKTKERGVKCNEKDSSKLYKFSFPYCSTPEKMKAKVDEWKKKNHVRDLLMNVKQKNVVQPHLISPYYLCFSESRTQTRYTVHALQPSLFPNNENINDLITDVPKHMGIESFQFEEKFFTDIGKLYKNQQVFSPTFMVPNEDMPFAAWKQATNNSINVAPLRTHLQPLMNAINAGIRKAAAALEIRSRHKNSLLLDANFAEYHNLKIYTVLYNLKKNSPTYLGEGKKHIVPDIWCKVVHSVIRQSAVVVFIHNTTSPPDSDTRQCDPDEVVTCNFAMWSANSLTADVQSYAYCCRLANEVLETIFPGTRIMKDVNAYLNIEELIKEYSSLQESVYQDQSLTVVKHFLNDQASTDQAYQSYTLRLPSKVVEDGDRGSYTSEPNEEEINLCPVNGQHEHELVLRKLSKYYWAYKYCLQEKHFELGETKICDKEIEPLLISRARWDTPVHNCGPHPRSIFASLFRFGYAYCPPTEILENILTASVIDKMRDNKNAFYVEPDIIELYQICYIPEDMEIMFTTHRISSPSFFKNPLFRRDSAFKCHEIGTQSYDVRQKVPFTRLRNAYSSQQENDPNRMVAQMLVPTEHMALTLWKITTCHYINTAPLWQSLAPLMDLIDTRIKNLSIAKNIELFVYTAVMYIEQYGERLYLNKTSVNTSFPVPNIWCKLVYDDVRHKAIAIIIFNTPNSPPNHLKKKFCAVEISCDFKNWRNEEKSKDVDDQKLQYAFCCQVDDAIKSYYGENFQFQVDQVLEINENFTL